MTELVFAKMKNKKLFILQENGSIVIMGMNGCGESTGQKILWNEISCKST